MTEFGLFNDEGCVEAGFYSEAEARAAIDHRFDAEDELTAREICPEHEEQARDTCEDCFADEEEGGQ
jgi:hypothetical protein